jgi:hypothetical protein
MILPDAPAGFSFLNSMVMVEAEHEISYSIIGGRGSRDVSGPRTNARRLSLRGGRVDQLHNTLLG